MTDKQKHSEKVTSHVGRNLLNEARGFSNEGKAVGEYVKNSWQYTNDHVTVEVMVNQEEKSIQIKDNSEGMDSETLNERFFILHQKNIDREKGIDGRGEHGTGKVAALGIGEILSVRTVKDKKINEFEIHRKDCDSDKSVGGVPIVWRQKNITTDEKNGTIINILNFRQQRKISISSIKKFLQTRTLVESAYNHEDKNGKKVATNIKLYLQEEHLERKEIPFSKQYVIKPDETYENIIGSAELTIKIADRQLENDEKGVLIFTKGIQRAFIKNPPAKFNEMIFGSCSCDKLMDETMDPPIFLSSRGEELSEDNEVARKFKEFVTINVDKIRKELEKNSNDKKQKEKEDSLKEEAEKMKDFFNSDYMEQELDFQKRAAKARGNIDDKDNMVASLGETKLVIGKDFKVNIIEGDDGAGIYDGRGDGEGGEGTDSGKSGGKLEKTEEETSNLGKEKKSKKRNSGGGFNVIFKGLGTSDFRASYNDSERTLIVNLDHPYLSKIEEMAGGRLSTKFLRHAYEAACLEYAVAVTQQKGNSNSVEDSLSEGVTTIKEHVDSLMRKLTLQNLFND